MSRNQDVYYDLVIVAEAPDTELWLGDHEGYFVQKAVGTLSCRLLPGRYVVEFGLGSPRYDISLSDDRHDTERQLRAGEPLPRRRPSSPEA